MLLLLPFFGLVLFSSFLLWRGAALLLLLWSCASLALLGDATSIVWWWGCLPLFVLPHVVVCIVKMYGTEKTEIVFIDVSCDPRPWERFDTTERLCLDSRWPVTVGDAPPHQQLPNSSPP